MIDNLDILASEAVYGNIWVREIVFMDKGDMKAGHKHQFDHVHFLAQGSIELKTMNGDTELSSNGYKAPAWIKVPKEVHHSIVALEDMTVGYCIEALRDADGEVMESDFTKDLAEGKDTAVCNKIF